MKFIIDAQLPPALARYLSSKGVDAIHVLDLDMMESSDSEIWVRIGNCSKNSLIDFFEKKWDEIIEELNKGSQLIELI